MAIQPLLILDCLSLWFVLSSLYRLVRFLRHSPTEPDTSSRIIPLSPNLLMASSVLILSASLLFGSRLFLTNRLLTSGYALAGALLFTGCVDGFLALRRSQPSHPSRWHWFSSLTSLAIGMAALVFVLFLRSSPGVPADGIVLDYPVRGEWIVATGGRSAITNYHHGRPDSQNYAVDLIRASGDSAGEPVYSPASGTVIKSISDRIVGGPEPEGNLVIVKATGGVQVWMAHLETDSLLIGEGDTVESGQPIARCGSTGSADVAHLHIHAQRDGIAVAMYFEEEERFLLRNDRVVVGN